MMCLLLLNGVGTSAHLCECVCVFSIAEQLTSAAAQKQAVGIQL